LETAERYSFSREKRFAKGRAIDPNRAGGQVNRR